MSSQARPLLVGLAGGTGSGKTTIARAIVAELPAGSAALLQHDAYYRERDDLSPDELARVNFDHPDSLDNELLCAHLRQLQQGEPIEVPIYDYVTHRRRAETTTVEPSPVVVVEGILLFAHAALRELFDIRLFIDTQADIRILRRIRRDMEQRGRTFEEVRRQYYATVRPMHEAFVEPTRRYADLIIPEGGTRRVAIEVIAERMRRELRERGWDLGEHNGA